MVLPGLFITLKKINPRVYAWKQFYKLGLNTLLGAWVVYAWFMPGLG